MFGHFKEMVCVTTSFYACHQMVVQRHIWLDFSSCSWCFVFNVCFEHLRTSFLSFSALVDGAATGCIIAMCACGVTSTDGGVTLIVRRTTKQLKSPPRRKKLEVHDYESNLWQLSESWSRISGHQKLWLPYGITVCQLPKSTDKPGARMKKLVLS